MSLEKTIMIDGKEVKFKASAAIPRLYRIQFGRDIYRDISSLDKAMKKSDPEHSELGLPSLEVFENIAYIMARHADPTVPDSVEKWLDQFSTFSIYEILPQLIELWGLNVETQVEAKKNSTAFRGK